jgi:hypothetical protein
MQACWVVSGNTLTMNTWWSDNWGRPKTFDASIWQILPSSSGRGLLVQDSTDFSITDATMSGYCTGTVTFMPLGYTDDKYLTDRYMVFAK